jgi:hypothetical protein
VRNVVPPAATALVASKGDDALTQLDGRYGWHFPRDSDGQYAGHHPADSDDAISRLEALRREGAEYLVLPSTMFWWLDHYEVFGRHLDDDYRLLLRDDDCMIFHLVGAEAPKADTDFMPVRHRQDQTWEQAMIAQLVEGLLPSGAATVVLSVGDGGMRPPAGCRPWRIDTDTLATEQGAADALRRLAAEEAEYLVIPSSDFKWTEQNPALENALRSEHRLVTRQGEVCEIFELSREIAKSPDNGEPQQARPVKKAGLFGRVMSALGLGR